MNSIAYGDLSVNGSPVPAAPFAGRVAASTQLVQANHQLLERRTAQRCQQNKPTLPSANQSWLGCLSTAKACASNDSNAAHTPAAPRCATSLTVHPVLLTAMLKQEQAAIGRIWLLLKALDSTGRGCLDIQFIRQQLAQKPSPLRVCGWRRLRQILTQGNGTFWQRDNYNRLFIYSPARVAAKLGIMVIVGDAVELPVVTLLGSIGDVRAAFYTAFHAGREQAPISRATLHTITGVPERTQRHYDKAQQTQRITNLSLLPLHENAEAAWQHGRAAFRFTDKAGQHGAVGQNYTAVRLPNSYTTTRYARLKGKRKRLNKRLKQVLVIYGIQGNSTSSLRRLFFADGKMAARCFGRKQNGYLHDQCIGNRSFWIEWGQ